MTQHHVPQGRSGAGEDAHLVAHAQPDLGEDLETPELGEAPELGGRLMPTCLWRRSTWLRRELLRRRVCHRNICNLCGHIIEWSY